MGKKFFGIEQTLMSKKYITMLFGGTLTAMVVSILLMSDQIIAGITIGSDAVAGITMVTPIYSFSAFFGTMISMGVPIVYSAEMGKFNKERADKAFGLGVLTSVAIGVILFTLISLFANTYLHMSTVSDKILRQAIGYLFWMRFTILVMPVQMLFGAIVYSDGDETISNIANIVQGVGNIVCSAVLSRIIGIEGIGLASFLFNVISFLIFLLHFRSENNSLRMNLYFSFGMLKEVVYFSIINSSSFLFLSAFAGVLNFYVTTHYGSEYLILVSAITLAREFQMLFEGIGEAVKPIFGVYVGENSHEGLKATYALAYKTAAAEGIIVAIAMMFLASVVPEILNVTRPDLAGWVVIGVRMTAIGSIFISQLYLLTSYYLVIERIVLGLVACAVRDVIFSISLPFVLGGIWGIYGMFVGLVLAPVLAYASLMLYIIIRYGRADCPLLLSKVPGGDNCYLFNLTTDPKEIIDLQSRINSLLIEHDIDKKTINRVALLIEEMYILIRQMNNNSAVLAECTVFFEI